MQKRARPTLAAAGAIAILALAGLLIPGCGDDDDVEGYCEDGQCECAGNDCVCPAAGDCGIRCTEDCDLRCAGSGSCEFRCDDDCRVACTGSGNCVAALGARGRIECTGSGDCAAACSGNCGLRCSGSGDCSLACADGQQPTECGDDVTACGDCP